MEREKARAGEEQQTAARQQEEFAAERAAWKSGFQEKQQALEQWLERVPDDPGGLLRRKFAIEYQRRMQQSGGDQ